MTETAILVDASREQGAGCMQFMAPSAQCHLDVVLPAVVDQRNGHVGAIDASHRHSAHRLRRFDNALNGRTVTACSATFRSLLIRPDEV